MISQGIERVLIYPEVQSDDGYGTPTRVAGLVATLLPNAWVFPVTALESQSLGQAVGTVYEIVADTFPAGAWALVQWAGRDWDVLGEPRRYESGFTGTQLSCVYIKARGPQAL